MWELIESLGKLAVAVGTAIYEAATMSPEEQAAVKRFADDKQAELAAVRAGTKVKDDAKTAETRAVLTADEPAPITPPPVIIPDAPAESVPILSEEDIADAIAMLPPEAFVRLMTRLAARAGASER
jgi:hypothetical protein